MRDWHRVGLLRDFDQFEILAQEVVDEDGEVDAFGAGERGEAGLQRAIVETHAPRGHCRGVPRSLHVRLA